VADPKGILTGREQRGTRRGEAASTGAGVNTVPICPYHLRLSLNPRGCHRQARGLTIRWLRACALQAGCSVQVGRRTPFNRLWLWDLTYMDHRLGSGRGSYQVSGTHALWSARPHRLEAGGY
jgi:hypothetical protein